DALQILAGDVHTRLDAGARAQEDRVVLLLQIVQRNSLANARVGDEGDAGLFQVADLTHDDVLFELEAGDAVDEHAARLRPRLIHRNLVPQLNHVLGHGDSRRARADDGDALAAPGRRYRDRQRARLAGHVGDKRLQLADGGRAPARAEHT